MAKNRLSAKSHLSRHSHNISAGYTSTITTGPIVPQYFHVLSPGDSIYFKPKCFCRLNDLVTAFLGEIEVNVDVHFVPLDMIFTAFGSRFTLTNDIISSTLKSSESMSRLSLAPVMSTQSFSQWANNIVLPYHQDCVGRETARLLDAFDMNPLFVCDSQHASQVDYTKSASDVSDLLCSMPQTVSPYIVAAYQAIYQKFYRNDSFEAFDIQAYNVDQYYNSPGFVNERMCRLRYVTRKDDYFTSVRPSALASAVNTAFNTNLSSNEKIFPSDGGTFNSVFTQVNDYLGFGQNDFGFNGVNNPIDGEYNFGHGNTAVESTTVAQDVNLFPTAANIRALFAVDKFMRIYGRAGKTYDDQILAHFGVKVPHDVKHDITTIERFKFSLVADPVYSTSTQGSEQGSTLGQVGGQGSGGFEINDSKKFTAPVHGVFMVVMYARTKPQYFGTFSKLHAINTRVDLPIPEFDKLGAQPLYWYEAFQRYLSDSDDAPMASRVGWQNRYNQYKQKYNRVSLNFVNSDEYVFGSNNDNIYAHWVLSSTPYLRGGVGYGDNFVLRSLFERPNSLNVVMSADYELQWSNDFFESPYLMFSRDPIISSFYMDAKLVSWMSPTGEPDL